MKNACRITPYLLVHWHFRAMRIPVAEPEDPNTERWNPWHNFSLQRNRNAKQQGRAGVAELGSSEASLDNVQRRPPSL
jgi:hypothetical protein